MFFLFVSIWQSFAWIHSREKSGNQGTCVKKLLKPIAWVSLNSFATIPIWLCLHYWAFVETFCTEMLWAKAQSFVELAQGSEWHCHCERTVPRSTMSTSNLCSCTLCCIRYCTVLWYRLHFAMWIDIGMQCNACNGALSFTEVIQIEGRDRLRLLYCASAM